MAINMECGHAQRFSPPVRQTARPPQNRRPKPVLGIADGLGLIPGAPCGTYGQPAVNAGGQLFHHVRRAIAARTAASINLRSPASTSLPEE